MKVKIDPLLDRIEIPGNVSDPFTKEKPPLIFIPNDKSYVEIDGHRFDDISSFEEFIDLFKDFGELIVTNNTLKKDIKKLLDDRDRLIFYLDKKIEESRFLRDHINGEERLSIQETIYREIRGLINER